ncbi:MAG: hypothetical protein OXU79_09430 [Gemmatimonadota bacterium]|nr:hypothetical protein [Gemmatimonadota bacterium]
MNPEIPKRAFFIFAWQCPYRSDPPVIDGDLQDWDRRFRMPDLMALDGREAFADVYAAWSERGLYFAVNVRKAAGANVDRRQPLQGDGMQIWLDTRNVRNAHRASRYCHHFYFLPATGRAKQGGGQTRIRRARAHSRMCESSELPVACDASGTGYRMEVHLPAKALTGFDPDENSLLGFTYLLQDRRQGRQWWTADEPLPVSYDPSLWGTIELVK